MKKAKKIKSAKQHLTDAQTKARVKWYKKQRKAGLCVACKRKALVNKTTGKSGPRCRAHQDAANEYNRKYNKQRQNKANKKLQAKRKHDAQVKREKRAGAKAARLREETVAA